MRECETDDRSCPLSERSSPGVNIAFPCLPQLQACSLVHLLQRVKMEERDTPVGGGEYRPPHTHTPTLLSRWLKCVWVLQGTKSHFVWCHLKNLPLRYYNWDFSIFFLESTRSWQQWRKVKGKQNFRLHLCPSTALHQISLSAEKDSLARLTPTQGLRAAGRRTEHNQLIYCPWKSKKSRGRWHAPSD